MIYTSEKDIQTALTKPQPTAKGVVRSAPEYGLGAQMEVVFCAYVVVNKEKRFAKYIISESTSVLGGGWERSKNSRCVTEGEWSRFVAARWSAKELGITDAQHAALANSV